MTPRDRRQGGCWRHARPSSGVRGIVVPGLGNFGARDFALPDHKRVRRIMGDPERGHNVKVVTDGTLDPAAGAWVGPKLPMLDSEVVHASIFVDAPRWEILTWRAARMAGIGRSGRCAPPPEAARETPPGRGRIWARARHSATGDRKPGPTTAAPRSRILARRLGAIPTRWKRPRLKQPSGASQRPKRIASACSRCPTCRLRRRHLRGRIEDHGDTHPHRGPKRHPPRRSIQAKTQTIRLPSQTGTGITEEPKSTKRAAQ